MRIASSSCLLLFFTVTGHAASLLLNDNFTSATRNGTAPAVTRVDRDGVGASNDYAVATNGSAGMATGVTNDRASDLGATPTNTNFVVFDTTYAATLTLTLSADGNSMSIASTFNGLTLGDTDLVTPFKTFDHVALFFSSQFGNGTTVRQNFIDDVVVTPGMLALLEKHRPDAEVTLWPSSVGGGVEAILRARFPKLKIAKTKEQQVVALEECDFFLHGSGPLLVGLEALKLAVKAGKPYGIGGITMNDQEINDQRDLLAGAKFVFLRDTDSLRAVQAAGISGPKIGLGPDATFAIDLRDDPAAAKLMQEHRMAPGKFLCAIPRLRWTPYWEIHPKSTKPNAERIKVNEEFAGKDHAKLREGITAWVRETKMRVLLTPEMTYAVPLLRTLLFDKLPDDVKPHVSFMDRYWLTAEACSVYAQAAAIVSLEQHSPIMGIAAGVPSVLVRQPTDTRKGRMWYDLKMEDWVFEIDQTTGTQVAERLVQIGRDLPAARTLAAQARATAHERMAAMIAAIP